MTLAAGELQKTKPDCIGRIRLSFSLWIRLKSIRLRTVVDGCG